MIAAVARIMSPGCKVDTVLMLEGTQGKRKSSAIEGLFSKPWFSDDLAELGTKDSAMQMAGVWCIEIADLASMKRADIDKVKAFITRKVDRFRPPYGRNVIEAPRASILIATTNLDDWGKDETGGRRFWPVQCEGDIDVPGITRLRDQLWAEAVALYRANEEWWLIDDAIIQTAREEVENRAAGDPWDGLIQQAVASKTSVTVEEILDNVLGVEKARQGRAELMRVVSILKRLHWRKDRRMRGGVRVTAYLAPNA
jgi:predicted P-loop ATPase